MTSTILLSQCLIGNNVVFAMISVMNDKKYQSSGRQHDKKCTKLLHGRMTRVYHLPYHHFRRHRNHHHHCHRFQDGMSGVYAEVAKLRTWIDTKIAENGGGAFCN